MKNLLLLLLAVSLCFSATVVINSQDGRDVVSGVYYAALKGDRAVFVPPSYSESVTYGKIGWNGEVLLIQSSSNPLITGMANELRNKGNTVEIFSSEEPYAANRLLAEKARATKFILVDPVYGYNTVSALPYAKLNGMYLIFADKGMKNEVISFLRGRGATDILIYGYMDGEIKDALDANGLPYREINTGDKFDDNMELVDRYFSENPSKKQALFSDGNAFEDTIAAGDDPVILISPVIPASVYNFIREKASSGQLKVGMVVDREYAQTAYDLKKSVNSELGQDALHVLVKFGQSVPSAGSGLFDVDLFPVRGPILGLAIRGAQYNTATGQIEITYENTGNALEYVSSRMVVFVDGRQVQTIGDEEPFQVGRGQQLGRGYPISIESGQIALNMTAMYGSSKKSTENGIVVFLDAGRLEYTDRSSLEVSGFTEEQESGDLLVTYYNPGEVASYFRADAAINASGRITRIEDDRLYELSAGEAKIVKFPGVMKDAAGAVAGANYGSRAAFLEKRVEGQYVPAPKSAFDMNLILILLVALLVAVVGYLLWEKKGKKK